MLGTRRSKERYEARQDKDAQHGDVVCHVADSVVCDTVNQVANSLGSIPRTAEGVVWVSDHSLGDREVAGRDGQWPEPDYYALGQGVFGRDEHAHIYLDIDNPDGYNDTDESLFEYPGYKTKNLAKVAIGSAGSGASITFQRETDGGWSAEYGEGDGTSEVYSGMFGDMKRAENTRVDESDN